jgi:hypothetical protein
LWMVSAQTAIPTFIQTAIPTFMGTTTDAPPSPPQQPRSQADPAGEVRGAGGGDGMAHVLGGTALFFCFDAVNQDKRA